MKSKYFLLVLVLSLFGLTTLTAQGLGGHPSNIKWQQVNTKKVRVIFPEGLEKRAFRIANIINHVNKNNTYSVGDKSRKINLVLQTNQVMSNGFVALSPYRSEFYGTGLQDHSIVGSLDWLDLLSLHEYRHALQYVNADRGFTKFLHILQGQNGWAMGVNIAVPAWFFEGDAVMAETLLSPIGRGRTPSFFRELRANLLNGKDYAYMTEENGSYKKLIPDHYRLGFVMNNYVRNKYGMDVWGKILADAGRYKSIIYPFSGAMKKHTGKTSKAMYKDAYADLKQRWEEELKTVQLRPTQAITKKPKRTVTNYNYPQLLSDGSIVAIKGSYKDIPHLVQIKKGKERRLCNYGKAPALFLSENQGKLAWTELQQDPRRANRNYTKVVVYDMQTKKKSYITSKSKYFSPEFAHRGNKLAVVKADEQLQNKIEIIDATNGKVLNSLGNPNNDFISYPKWTDDDQSIIYIAKRNSKLTLMKYELYKGVLQPLISWTAHTISSFDVVGDKVYFTSSYSGIDNIYEVSTNGDGILKQISSVKIGAYEPTVSRDKQKLVMVEYNDMGTQLTTMNLNQEPAQARFTYVEPIQMAKYEIKTNANEHNVLDEIDYKDYKVKRYRGFFGGLKLHSWSLGVMDRNPKLALHLDNILTNLSITAGAMYNKNEKGLNYFGNLTYSKHFVEVGLNAKIQNRSESYFKTATELGSGKFKENNYGISLATPLNWNKGSYLYSFKPMLEYNYHHTYDYKDMLGASDKLKFSSLTSSVLFSAKRMKAHQNIFPRYGIELGAEYQRSIDKSVKAERIDLGGTLYLPSLFRNHGFRIDANWQKELLSNNFKFVDVFTYARGYESLPHDEIYTLGVNYSLPLFYPDWGFSGITYFKRIKANLFYDMSKVKLANRSINQNSYGIEVISENTVLNLIPMSIGFRQSFLLNKDILNTDRKSKFEFLLNIGM